MTIKIDSRQGLAEIVARGGGIRRWGRSHLADRARRMGLPADTKACQCSIRDNRILRSIGCDVPS
jgi:hypothetical protein